MSAVNSTFYIGVRQVFLDYLPIYKKCVNYAKQWVTTLCHREVEEVLYDNENVAPDLLTIKDRNITVNFLLDMWHLNSKVFSKVGMFFPLETSSVFIFSKNPIKVEKNSFHNFLPIQANVYLSLLGLMTLASCILVLTNNPIISYAKVIRSQTSEFANMAAILIRQGEIKSGSSLSYKVLFGSWLLGAFLFSVMTQTYLNCEFTNVQYIPMDSVADVADNLDIVEPMVFGNTFIETFLNTSLNPKARFIWRHLKENDQLLSTNDFDHTFDRVNNAKHFALFLTKNLLLLLQLELMGLSASDKVHEGPPIFTASLGPLHSADISPACKEQINRKLIKLQEIRFLEMERKESIYELDQYTFRPTLEQDAEFILSLGEAKSTLGILAIGYVASVTYFTVHFILASRRDHKRRSKLREARKRRTLSQF